MYTIDGDEVYSFSQLRNEYADVETFYLDSGPRAISPVSVMPAASPLRRSRSSNGITMNAVIQNDVPVRQRARSKSRPRTLYAADNSDPINRSNGGKNNKKKNNRKHVVQNNMFSTHEIDDFCLSNSA